MYRCFTGDLRTYVPKLATYSSFGVANVNTFDDVDHF